MVTGIAPEERFEAALVLHEADELDAAEAAYHALLREAPGHADALHMLGLLADQRGEGEAAVSLIGRAIALSPGRAYAHANLGNALHRLGRAGEAVASHRRAVALRPDSAAMLGNLVAALLAAGDGEAAVAAGRRLVALAPGSADAWLRLGGALSAGGASAEAAEALRRCVALDPGLAEAWYNLGCLALAGGDAAGAAALLREALALRPVFAQARTNLGVALHRLGLLAEAAECHRTAIRDDPAFAGAHHNLGCVALARNRMDEAAESFRAVLALRPKDGPARFGLCASRLPMLYRDEAEIGRRRAEYAAELSALAAACEDADEARALAAGVGSSPPFFLAYQGRDDRALQAAYGTLCCRLVEAAHGAAPAPRPAADGRIRVALVSGFFCRHTVWSLLLRGWLEHLDRGRFAVSAFHTGTEADAVTARAAALADRFVSGARPLPAWRDAILAGEPDVVLYPEIGMDPVAAHLAAHRLAPVQAMSWGHPVTSGMPSIDLFLSSALMEPADGEGHYTERLVRLPNLGTCYEPDVAEAARASRASLGLRDGAVAFWSGQALYKYRPLHDAVFARIAAEVGAGSGDAQFVFIEFAREPEVTALFRARLERAFAAEGLEAARHCVFLPSLGAAAFVGAIGACDVVLDTPGWSGGKSTLDGLAQALPVVTLPGPLMRSRHTAAILARIGAPELIARSEDEYVAMAVRLALDAGARAAAAARVRAGRHRAFGDRRCIEAMEDVLEGAVRGGGKGRPGALPLDPAKGSPLDGSLRSRDQRVLGPFAGLGRAQPCFPAPPC